MFVLEETLIVVEVLIVEVEGLTVEVEGLIVEVEGLTVEVEGLTVEVKGLTVEVEGLTVLVLLEDIFKFTTLGEEEVGIFKKRELKKSCIYYLSFFYHIFELHYF